jgi:cytochrome c-type biogenesis protein CcmH
MTQFLILGALLTAAAVGCVLWPFRRRGTSIDPARRKRDNLDVYHQRVAELRREQHDGNLDADDLESLMEELSGALLDDVPEEGGGERPTTAQRSVEGPLRRALLPVGLASLVPVFAIVVYINLGAGADLELAGASGLLRSNVDRPVALAELVVQLERRLDVHPDDFDSLYLLGHVRMRERNFAAAASSFSRAVALNRFDPDTLISLIQANFLADGGRISEANRGYVDRLQAVAPGQALVLEMLASDASAAADYAGAANYLERALSGGAAGPEAAALRAELQRVRGLAGIGPGPAIDVTVTGLAGIDGLTSQAVLYVMARRSGERMPRMVVRRGVGEDVLKVRLDGAALMGQQDPLREGETLEVIARLSRTGDVRPGPDVVEAISRPVTLAAQPVAVRLSLLAATGRGAEAAVTERAVTEPRGPVSVAAAPETDTAAMVRIELAAANDVRADPGTRVFVIVRALTGPPMPLAVRALTFAELPAVIQLTDADAMQPGRLLSRFEEVAVLARLSRSGSPTPRPGDVESEIAQVRPLDRPTVSLRLN